MAKSSGGLSRWFKEEWVDLSRPKKGGGFEPCGRPDADEGKYPKCVPKAKAMKMTQAEIDSAVRRKRRAESTEERKGKKPINVPTEVEKKSKNIPTNPKLYAKVKAEAKRKFDVYPSAYANGWLVQEYKRRGGGYKTVTKQQPASSEVHVPSTNWKFKRKKNRGLSSLVDKHADHDQKSHGSWAGGYQQRLFGEPEERYGFKPPPSKLEELGLPSNLTGLISELEEESTRDISMSEEEFLASYGLEASDFTVDGGTKVTQVIDSDGIFQGYFLTYEVNGETSVAYEKEFQEVSYRLDIEDMVVEQVPDWRREYVNGRPLYHGTTPDNIASIAEMGLESRNDRRGMSNRQIGSAVFLSAEPGYSEAYGEVLIEVDMDRLLADGVLSAKDAFPEPNVLDAQVLQSIAYSLDEYDYVPEVGLEAYPDTTVIFEGPGVVIPPEYMTVDGLPMKDYAASISKHANHDQKSHGSWARGVGNQIKFKGKVVSNPKPFAGANKKVEEGHEARPLPEVGDRIGIHLDLNGVESGLDPANAFSIKMINRNGNPRYNITQAHTLGVRLSDIGTHVSRSRLNSAVTQGSKNPHAAFTGKVEEWVNSREIPKGAVEIGYHIDLSKNPDGTPTQTVDTTGFWYVKDGTYRDFIGASDGIGIGGDLSEGGDKARTYVYGDVELGEVNPHVKEFFENRKLTKAHRLIHESRTRQRPFELAKHGDHDQLSHGNWAQGRVGSSRGVPIPDGYVVLSAAERKYLASLPELSQGTLMRQLPVTGGERLPRLGADGNWRFEEERVSVDPSDFSHVYKTKAGMVIDSAEPKYFDEYESGDQLADDIFDLGIVTNEGRTLAVEASGYNRGDDTAVSLTITDVNTGEHLGGADRVIVDDPWTGVFVENNLFKLDEDIQGMGIGTTLLSHWEDQMAKAGVGNMRVHAVSSFDMNGGYTWLRYGYTPDDPFGIVRSAPFNDIFFPADMEGRLGDIVRQNNVAITNKALDMAIDNNPGMNIGVDFDASDIEIQVGDEITRRMSELRRELRSSEQAGSTLFTDAEDVLMAPSLIRNEYESIFTREIPVDVKITVRPTDQPFDDRSLDEKRTVTIGVEPVTFMSWDDDQDERFYEYLKTSADWYGEKPTSELNLQPKERATVVRADVIDRDGDGIIFEGTPFERRIGTASRQVAKGKAKKKKLRGPAKPSSLSELARWWADNDPAAWEQDTAEVRASYRRYLFSKARVDSKRKLKKHGTHDQKSHGNWARNLRIFRHIMENEGATFDIRTREFKKDGFAVADPAQAYQAEEKHSSPVFAEEGRKLIGEFIKNWEGELTEPNKYVGAWLDDGNYYLDVATVVMDRSKAIEMGKETDQIAIWDLGANAEVRLRKAGSRVLLVPGDALNEETIELLFNELMRLNDE